MAKILITGGSGLVGSRISELLVKEGHQPCWLSRQEGESNGIRRYKWDLSKKYIDEKSFEDTEHIIHLAGSGIVDKRWTHSYKKEILDSRVKTSELLFDHISKNNYPIKTLVGGSAIGYYGALTSEHTFSEEDLPGHDFLGETCVLWEKSYDPFVSLGIRTVIIRTGIVLSQKGGAYAKMVKPFKFGLGAAIGSGNQYFPWIHIDDIAAIFVHALFHDALKGSYNATATEQITNKEFSRHLAISLRKPFFLPVLPAFLLKMALGERAITITEGVKINNSKLKNSGFLFRFDSLEAALNDLNK
jgi:uncharacterized protein